MFFATTLTWMGIAEPDVTLTDYVLFLEFSILAWLLCRKPRHPIRTLMAISLFSSGISALLGGTVHGFFSDEKTLPCILLWRGTLLGLGVMSWSFFMLGTNIIIPKKYYTGLFYFACLQLAIYTIIVLFVSQAFWIVIINYLPASLFILVASIIKWIKSRQNIWLGFIIGVFLMLVASFIQSFHIALHPIYFNHNAMYHLVMFIAVFGLFYTSYYLTEEN